MLQKYPIIDFLFQLEYYLSFSRDPSIDKRFWGFWCDGINTRFEEEELRDIINRRRVVELMMFFGESGQDEYKLIIHFGRKAVSRSARGLHLKECLPDRLEESDMISIDTDSKIVELRLK